MMYSDSKRTQLIQEMLRTENNDVLRKVESILKKSRTPVSKKVKAHDFLGTWTTKDAELIDKAIEEGCEKIYLNEWR